MVRLVCRSLPETASKFLKSPRPSATIIITETALGWARFLPLWHSWTSRTGRGGGTCGEGVAVGGPFGFAGINGERRLTAAELAARLWALDALASGKLRPPQAP